LKKYIPLQKEKGWILCTLQDQKRVMNSVVGSGCQMDCFLSSPFTTFFSAKIVAEHFEGVFCRGFSRAASTYGLPDVGYVNWRDMTDFTTKIRHTIPITHILVEVGDGFGDEVVTSNTVRILESKGSSTVMM
jgi:2-methylisocitrate lyase-like PEP mutase family enzyme